MFAMVSHRDMIFENPFVLTKILAGMQTCRQNRTARDVSAFTRQGGTTYPNQARVEDARGALWCRRGPSPYRATEPAAQLKGSSGTAQASNTNLYTELMYSKKIVASKSCPFKQKV